MTPATSATARVKVLNDRRFGFLTNDSGNDWFFHESDLVLPLTFDDLGVGDVLRFEPKDTTKGLRATRITKDGDDNNGNTDSQ